MNEVSAEEQRDANRAAVRAAFDEVHAYVNDAVANAKARATHSEGRDHVSLTAAAFDDAFYALWHAWQAYEDAYYARRIEDAVK